MLEIPSMKKVMASSYFWNTDCQKYLGLDLPINTKNTFDVLNTHIVFLKHIQNSWYCHGTKNGLCAWLNTLDTGIFLNSASKQERMWERTAFLWLTLAEGKGKRVHVLDEGEKGRPGNWDFQRVIIPRIFNSSTRI